MGDNQDTDSLSRTLPTFPPIPPFKSRVGPVGIAVAVCLGLLLLLILYCILKRSCKRKCCQRKKPSLAKKVLKKMGLKKSKQKQPFSVSRIVDKK